MSSSAAVLRIGDLRVDPALDEIAKDGQFVNVEPRTMRLLVCPVSPWCEQPAVPAEVVPASAAPPAASPLATIDFAAAVDQAAASLATVLIDDLGWHDSTDMLNPCGRAHKAVDEAVRLDSTLARVHVAKARVLTDCDRNTAAAEIELKRALEIEPDNPYNWRAYAWMAGAQRKPDKSLRLAQESVIRDPLDAWAYITLGEAQNGTAQFASAEGSFRRAVELDPNVKGVHAMHANSLLGLNRPAEALQEVRLEIDEQFRLMTEPLALDALGRTAEAERKIDEFKSKYSGRDPMTPAEFYACRKDADQALLLKLSRSK